MVDTATAATYDGQVDGIDRDAFNSIQSVNASRTHVGQDDSSGSGLRVGELPVDSAPGINTSRFPVRTRAGDRDDLE